MWFETRFVFVLIPTKRGLPLLVATSCPGYFVLLKARAKAPSCCFIECVGCKEQNLGHNHKILRPQETVAFFITS